MSAETLFTLANYSVLPGWLLLAVAPRWPWSARVIGAVLLPALLGMAYLILVVALMGRLDGGFGSLAEVALIFQNPYALLGGWIHYLAFDLFIGSWEVRDANKLGLSHWLVLPCLALTMLFGPAGLVLYFVLRWSLKRTFAVD